MEKKPQMMVKFKAGELALFDLENYEQFTSIFKQLVKAKEEWIAVGNHVILRREDLDRMFYFPEGYPHAQNQQVSVSQS